MRSVVTGYRELLTLAHDPHVNSNISRSLRPSRRLIRSPTWTHHRQWPLRSSRSRWHLGRGEGGHCSSGAAESGAARPGPPGTGRAGTV